MVDGKAKKEVQDSQRRQYEDKLVHFHKEIKCFYQLGRELF